jgi:hyperosmotically inducible periplasmic protein
MNTRTRQGTRAAAWLLAATLAVAVTPAASSAAVDAWITAKTKMALMTTEGAPATDVNVDTIDGKVTLHGKVTTEQAKTKAGEVAKGIEGVREVRNLLQVVPTKVDEQVQVADAIVRDRVVEALKAAPQLDGSDIQVQSVNDGVVLLAGKAESFADHLSAVTTATRVPGVRRVASEIQSPDKLADAEVGQMPSAGDVSATAKAGANRASDMWITGETKLRLLADGDAPALDINVDTDGGVVTLFGVVGTDAQKKAAEAAAKKVEGVKSVKNELEIVPSTRQEQVAAADGEVAQAIEAALDKRGSLDDVSVEVKNGVVRLSGEVPSEADRVTAAVVARSTPGVRSVLTEAVKVEAARG